MTWFIISIIGFTAVCGCAALAIILSGDDDDYQEHDWWRDQ